LKPDRATIYTIGHGTRTFDEFLAALRSAGVQRVVDVRRYPGSRRNPQFERSSLQRSLESAGLDYEWRGEELGGRRDPPSDRASRHPALRVAAFRNYADHMDTREFRGALELLLETAAVVPTAIMCAETPWWRCHRSLVADALLLEGGSVIHILDATRRAVHELHEAARADERSRPVYDAGVLPLG
jgi:uncharacterized protein (DUF488 family)